MTDDRRLLRWYPEQWRTRYGAELLALVDDVSEGRGPTGALRRSLLLEGLKERLREHALIGRDRPPTERIRAGARVTLVAWAALVVAGSGFARFSEHWQTGVPSRDRLVPEVMHGVVVVLAALGALAVVSVVLTALPSIRSAVSAGRWRAVRRPMLVAGGVTLAVVASTAGLAAWASNLTPAQRNGSYVAYLVAFLSWSLLVIAMIGAWTVAAIAVERQLDVPARLGRAMAIGSGVLTVGSVGIAGAILAWWIALARTAPWVLGGNQLGAPSSSFAWPLAGEAAVAVAAAVLALLGSTRLVSAARSTKRAR